MSNIKKFTAFVLCLVLAIGAMGTVAAAEGVVTLYSESGATIQVNEWEVSAYEAVGWHSNYADVVTTLYSANGSTVTVYKAQVAEYVAVGWYTAPVTTIYTIYGDSMLIYTADLPAYTAIGWSANYADVTTTLYSADGNTITVYNAQVDSYLAVGWSRTKPMVKVANYANSDIPDYGKVTGAIYKSFITTDDGSSTAYFYQYNDSDIYEYAEYLIADGWTYVSYNDGLYAYSKGNALVGISCKAEYNEAWIIILNDHKYVSATTTTTTTTTSVSTSRYYARTNVPDYGYVTGRVVTGTYPHDSGMTYEYNYYDGDFKKYGTYLQNNGWGIYKTKEDSNKITVYFYKGNKLMGYTFYASTGKVIITVLYD